MKRSEFLRKLGLGLGVAVVAPTVFAEKEHFTKPTIPATPQKEGWVWGADYKCRFIHPDEMAIMSKTYQENEVLIAEKYHKRMIDAIWGVPLK